MFLYGLRIHASVIANSWRTMSHGPADYRCPRNSGRQSNFQIPRLVSTLDEEDVKRVYYPRRSGYLGLAHFSASSPE